MSPHCRIKEPNWVRPQPHQLCVLQHQRNKPEKSHALALSSHCWIERSHVSVNHPARLRPEYPGHYSFFLFHGKTPLHHAVMKKRVKIALLLLNNDLVDISLCDNSGYSAADYISQTGSHASEIRALFDKARHRRHSQRSRS